MDEETPEEIAASAGYWHEALHTSHIMIEMVSDHLLTHPYIQSRDHLRRQCEQAADLLAEIYQAIGADHPDERPPAAPREEP
jgi:hypothetical protein